MHLAQHASCTARARLPQLVPPGPRTFHSGRALNAEWGFAHRYWEKMEAAGQFEPIRQEIATNTNPALKFQYGVPQTVSLNYQAPPPPGEASTAPPRLSPSAGVASHDPTTPPRLIQRRHLSSSNCLIGKSTGRYINQPDRGDVADEHVAADVSMHDARELCPPASLRCETRRPRERASRSSLDLTAISPGCRCSSHGFELKVWPSQLAADDFRNDGSVVEKYYEEMRELVKASSGA